MDASLDVKAGFWTSDMEAEVEMTASVTVESRNGRILGTTLDAEKDEEAGAGGSCEGGADALTAAAASTMR